MKISFLLLSIVLQFQYSLSQELPPVTQQQFEDLADATENELIDDEYIIRLDQFRKHPIDVNMASLAELQSLYFLTDLQIDQLIRYRTILGKLLNIYELQAVPSWDLITIRKAMPYITASNAITLKENFQMRLKGDQSLVLRISRRIEKTKEYDTSLSSHFLGDPNHLFLRYRFQYKNLLYFGVTADKDAGEEFFHGTQSKGFDFYSAHFFLKDIGNIKSLAIGDYTVNMGQGLIQWQSTASGKSADVISIKRQSPVLLPYRSGGEFNFNRGLGITWQKKNIEVSCFLSHKKISGNIGADSVRSFTSIFASGYHRTASEIADRNQVAHNSIGANLRTSFSSFRIGINTIINQFNIPIQKTDEPYKLFAPSGKQFLNSSLDYGYTFRNLHLFGELATDTKMNRAFVTGVLMSVDPRIDLSVLYRSIAPGYQILSANAFTENSLPVNETGYYIGMAVRPGAGWQLNTYADFYRFPWIKYRVNAPTAGYDYLVQLNYQPGKKYSLYLRYRNKNKPLNNAEGLISSPSAQIKKSLRFHFSSQLSRNLSLDSRWEAVWFNKIGKDAEEGFLGFIEGSWQATERLSANLRLQYFETKGYNSRLYAYESDVLYSFSIPAFFDKGLRYYLNFNYDLNKSASFWIRWSQTIYHAGTEISDIEPNKISELKVQVRYNF